jgi:hypothetical protein
MLYIRKEMVFCPLCLLPMSCSLLAWFAFDPGDWEGVYFYEILVNLYRTTWHYIPENNTFQMIVCCVKQNNVNYIWYTWALFSMLSFVHWGDWRTVLMYYEVQVLNNRNKAEYKYLGTEHSLVTFSKSWLHPISVNTKPLILWYYLHCCNSKRCLAT